MNTSFAAVLYKPCDFIGSSLSSGTLNPRHLIPTFSRALKQLTDEFDPHASPSVDYKTVLEDADALCRTGEFFTDAAGDCLCQLQDALGDFAPDGFYFGSLEGDGADFGFWEIDTH